MLESVARRRAKRGLGTSDWDERPWLFSDLIDVWDLWAKIHRRRQSTGFGPAPISTAEVMARLELECVPRQHWIEMDEMIQVVEEAWWKKQQKGGSGDGDKPTPSD